MQGFSQVNAGNYYPTEVARDISQAYSRMGMAQAELQNKADAEAERKRQKRKALQNTAILLGAAALTGGTAALAAPGAIGAAGGGFMGGLQTFGQGALGALTGGSSAATGAGGFAGALNTGAGLLGQIGTSMLTGGGGGGMGSGTVGGGSGGGMDVGQAALGALGSYFQETQAANKSSRILEGTLKDPVAREALYPGVKQEQVDALLKYKGTLGSIEGAQFLQTALPMLSRTGAGNVDFQRQLAMQGSRIAQQGDVELNKVGAAAMLDAYGKTPLIPTTRSTTGTLSTPIRLGIETGAQGTGF